ncbi:hypothetical protein BBJ29_001676 [Phytophthora kernoviae]|uniref:Complex 1 LYR protein domain-containing protein n=1 Tax=Phytophthora kernoviae TaxID=325452 RepID=A0A3F2RRX8_9STRA|nr:hypothetical protein BBP00_00004380 [Phytophthora kernoviae]RLN71103.1 hypothetical protein BBJ29_001676 [Phytophthora kernoviae]
MATKLRRPVLQLYAQCLRSARKCPQWEQREMMKTYVRMKFRGEMATQNPDRVRSLLTDAKEELERMEYYHSIYEAKKNAEAALHGANSECNEAYLSAEANFCANCGTKRPTIS